MGLLTPLYNLPNNVLEKQKRYQNDTRPLPLRGPRAKLYVGVYAVLFTAGMIGTTVGSWNMIKGEKSE
ncbi:hypothetical protein CC1G_08128 [Coprinopsis cinerea okayama7|uniref:Uncharacterized protein n=1 Tax=Coprinopsis cinerea (strain Okayama-7 / 130 / ATCC MYA-4618 / FGSC 9003) TaxID=240176 RepID=A8NZ09_COPC7|nr:hypothetical protein CC1G_08128 [Coprinopsis cinerea okayama7\|eukprot:XP_001837574.1 hypothetical protein CC1G_08128 [Coprinopsis cinerea okayama7\